MSCALKPPLQSGDTGQWIPFLTDDHNIDVNKDVHYQVSLYTDVVLVLFLFFWKTFFPHPYPFALAVNKSPAVYFLSHALDGL